MDAYDVAIVGAGLAGLQCARLLAARSLRVLLADRKTEVGHPVHTTGIFVRKTLEDFDLPESCLGPPVRRVVLYSPGGQRVGLSSRLDEFSLGRMAEIYRRFLDEAVDSGTEWAPSHRYTGCRRHGGESVLHFQTPDGLREVHARFVIGADGVTSRVAPDLALSRNREWIVGVEDVLHGTRLPDPADRAAFHCFVEPQLAPGYIGWVIDDDATGLHVGVGGYPARFNPARALSLFHQRITERFRLPSPTHVERRAGRIPVGGILLRLANRRGLLVGDAAGAASPLTAGGLDACLRLSTFAAHVVTAYLHGEPSGTSSLDSYSGARFAPRFISRRFMRRAFAWTAHPLFVELGFAVVRFRPLRSVARHVFFGRGSFPEIPAVRGWQPRPLQSGPR